MREMGAEISDPSEMRSEVDSGVSADSGEGPAVTAEPSAEPPMATEPPFVPAGDVVMAAAEPEPEEAERRVELEAAEQVPEPEAIGMAPSASSGPVTSF